jgi:rubrerythrin
MRLYLNNDIHSVRGAIFTCGLKAYLGYTNVADLMAKHEDNAMRRLRTEEDILKDQPVVKADTAAVCAVCGAELEMDKESGEYSCPVCDIEDEP